MDWHEAIRQGRRSQADMHFRYDIVLLITRCKPYNAIQHHSVDTLLDCEVLGNTDGLSGTKLLYTIRCSVSWSRIRISLQCPVSGARLHYLVWCHVIWYGTTLFYVIHYTIFGTRLHGGAVTGHGSGACPCCWPVTAAVWGLAAEQHHLLCVPLNAPLNILNYQSEEKPHTHRII